MGNWKQSMYNIKTLIRQGKHHWVKFSVVEYLFEFINLQLPLLHQVTDTNFDKQSPGL